MHLKDNVHFAYEMWLKSNEKVASDELIFTEGTDFSEKNALIIDRELIRRAGISASNVHISFRFVFVFSCCC